MSDKYTEVFAGEAGMGLWGHVPPEEAIAQARKRYQWNLLEAQKALDALEAGDVRVFHQLGPWAARNRRQVFGRDAP